MNSRFDISVVIPCLNEAGRLPRFLRDLVAHCRSSALRYEIIVVDDGSTDGTQQAALAFQKEFADLRVIVLARNRGKGHAVKTGLLSATGAVALFMDADGSVAPDEIEKNLHYLTESGVDIFVGSRVLKGEHQRLEVKWYRKLIGTVFNRLVRSLLFENIHDTQCGFKMFKKEVVGPLFSRTALQGFGFDIEVLYLATKMGYRIKEGPVSWHHMPGSKVNLLRDAPGMLWSILLVRNWHCTPINQFNQHMGPDEYQYMFDMEEHHWWFVSNKRLLMKLIQNTGKRSPTILDVGAGTGSKLVELGNIGKAVGVDVSGKAVDFCRRRGLSNVSQCPAEDIDQPDKGFDLVVCMEVLEQVVNPVQVLGELKRVLKDDGRLLLIVPALKLLWSQHDEALCHLRRYEKKTLTADLLESGLRLEKMGYLFFASFFVVAPIRILRRLRKPEFTGDTTTLPPKFLNKALIRLFNAEIWISTRVGLPLGTTLYAVARK